MSAARRPLLAVDDLCVRVDGRTLVRGLSLQVRPGEAWCIVGANGVGKTTLLHTLIGLHPAAAGSISIAGRLLGRWRLAELATVRGFLPQFVHDTFAASVLDIVLMGRHPHVSRWHWEDDADRRRAQTALEAMDLGDLAARDITTLSGGERRRAAIAALLAQDPQLLLLDEPIAHLDLHHQITVLRHLSTLAREHGKAILCSLHDPNLALRFATHALVMVGEADVRCGPVADVLDAQTLSAAFAHPVSAVHAGGRTVFVPD